MAPNSTRVDQILQYALLLAGQEDDYIDRDLGPIHLIKYVYLADLAFARRSGGDTFTSVDWQFYKFGPWSNFVHTRIDTALTAIHATKKVFESEYEDRDEWVRWQQSDDYRLDQLERTLPSSITMYLKRDVRKYGKDTAELLDYVYKTEPMLSAAPMEYLDFSSVGLNLTNQKQESQPLRFDELSNKKKKKFSEKMRGLREDIKARGSKSHKKTRVNPVQRPRYDSVFEQGVKWLDSLAGPEFKPGKKTVQFSEEVWKSKTRKNDEYSGG